MKSSMMMSKLSAIFQREGLVGFFRLLVVRFVSSVVALPITLSIIIISPWLQVRLVRLFSYRIGHYALNTELLLCVLDANYFNEKKKIKTFFYITPNQPICNLQLHRMWKRVIWILPFPSLWSQVDRFLMRFLGEGYCNDPIKKNFEESTGGDDRWKFLEKIKKPHIAFTAAEERKGQVLMKKLGVPLDAPFVCLLVRDSHYLKQHMPNEDWSYHDYRNSDINKFKAAANFLTKKGYFVIRLGKYVRDKFDIDDSHVIDYANSKLRSDFMDIYLSGHCYFIITTGTGLDSITQIFRRPYLGIDIPLHDLRSWYNWDLFIPKKLIEVASGKLIHFKETYRSFSRLTRKNLAEALKQKGWEFIDNMPEEIVEAVEEMLVRLTGLVQSSKEPCELQEQFWKDFLAEEAYDSTAMRDILSNKNSRIHIGDSFLKKNSALLD